MAIILQNALLCRGDGDGGGDGGAAGAAAIVARKLPHHSYITYLPCGQASPNPAPLPLLVRKPGGDGHAQPCSVMLSHAVFASEPGKMGQKGQRMDGVDSARCSKRSETLSIRGLAAPDRAEWETPMSQTATSCNLHTHRSLMGIWLGTCTYLPPPARPLSCFVSFALLRKGVLCLGIALIVIHKPTRAGKECLRITHIVPEVPLPSAMSETETVLDSLPRSRAVPPKVHVVNLVERRLWGSARHSIVEPPTTSRSHSRSCTIPLDRLLLSLRNHIQGLDDALSRLPSPPREVMMLPNGVTTSCPAWEEARSAVPSTNQAPFSAGDRDARMPSSGY
ncbi:hypothetical protein PMIN01_07588 [Paraphaeosphaeria minitans]|uniref:Uncharacterized protein n=1 Tax=Paraphaeosphaeria minitans TaxID=565426 RepID=A0A9P6GGQ1_9PLEO|nr:hypothetical protein PMIN01_07588 [Paraphaeosphaeria minitans]